jgi:uncharacterized delta-60 repeat protein
MKHVILFTIIISAFICGNSFAQNTQLVEEWKKVFTGANDDFGEKCVTDNQNNLYVLATGGVFPREDWLIVKYNSAGAQQWALSYDGPDTNSRDLPQDIAVDALGNVYAAGTVRNAASGTDVVVLRINSVTGAIANSVSYNGLSNLEESVRAITLDPAGNLYIAGSTQLSANNSDVLVIKYTAGSLTQEWLRTISSIPIGNDDGARDITADNSGFVYITGRADTVISTLVKEDFFTIKISSSGAIEWAKRFQSAAAGRDLAGCVRTDAAGNVYVLGSSEISVSPQNMEITIVKYNPSGAQVNVAYTASGITNSYDSGIDMRVSPAGNVYIIGERSGTNRDWVIAKYNSSLALQGNIIYHNGPSNQADIPIAMEIDNNENVFITGHSSSPDTLNCLTIKYNSNMQEVSRVRTRQNLSVDDIALGSNGTVYVLGGVSPASFEYDFFVVKYNQAVGIQQVSSEVPSEFSLKQNYPNPFNPATDFEFSVPGGRPSTVNLTVYDISGRVIAVLVNEPLKAGVYKYSFDGTALNSGVYFYRLTAGGYSETKKMVLVK